MLFVVTYELPRLKMINSSTGVVALNVIPGVKTDGKILVFSPA